MTHHHSTINGLGIAARNRQVFLFCTVASAKTAGGFRVASSKDGKAFALSPKLPTLAGGSRRGRAAPTYTDFRVARFGREYFLAYKNTTRTKLMLAAMSEDLWKWHDLGTLSGIHESATLVSDHSVGGAYMLYHGEKKSIRVAHSKNLKRWTVASAPVLRVREDFFDSAAIEVGSAFVDGDGLILLYYGRSNTGRLSVGAAVFDKENPKKLLWRTDYPLWEVPEAWMEKEVRALGFAEYGKDIVAYWQVADTIYGVPIERIWRDANFPSQIPSFAPTLRRFEKNPILEPREGTDWDAVAAFNPAAILEDGKIHILYRAIGRGDVSVVGYATSTDGVHIDHRSEIPAYTPRESFEGVKKNARALHPSIFPYISGGGGAGGIEDPRITRIDDMLYMTYVAFDGASEPRVALTSISVDDFHAHKWNKWSKPALMSQPGVVNKNACILPEKIKGKYVIFHRVYPDVLVDFVDDLDYAPDEKWLRTHAKIAPRSDAWDSRKIGVGPPPIKTKYGWLVIYQAVGEQDISRYKVGAMLLDLENPAKVLYRSRHPIMEPVEWYENNGHKWGVIYPCGAAVKDDTLYVYYGGADKVVCVATAKLNEFVEQLVNHESPHLTKVSVK